MIFVRTVATAVIATVIVDPLSAQGVFDMGVLTNTLSVPTGPQRGSPSKRPEPATAPVAALRYTSTPTLRRKAVDDYVARIRRANPDAARLVADQFAAQDYGAIYTGLMRGAGLRDDDAGDIIVAYTLLGWQIANRSAAVISDRQVRAVRRQIGPTLAANPLLSAPATRAAFGEEMKLLFVTLHAGWQSAEKTGDTQRYSDGVEKMWLDQSGRDLRRMVLTDGGLVPRPS